MLSLFYLLVVVSIWRESNKRKRMWRLLLCSIFVVVAASEVHKGDRVKNTTKWMIINMINRQAMAKHVPITLTNTFTYTSKHCLCSYSSLTQWYTGNQTTTTMILQSTSRHPGWRNNSSSNYNHNRTQKKISSGEFEVYNLPPAVWLHRWLN